MVQIFEVAFSRRMCCSRVWSVSTQQRFPFRSVVSPDNSARHLPHVFLAADHDSQVRAAKAQMIAQRLAFGHRDIGAVVDRALEQADADRVEHHDRQRAAIVGGFDDPGHVLELAEEVRILKNHRGGLIGDRPDDRFARNLAIIGGDGDQLWAPGARETSRAPGESSG